jgi:hypothetical protein
MLYHQTGNEEFIFLMDSENVYRINPSDITIVEYIFTVDFRSAQLTCMTGRYSYSRCKFNLFISDSSGAVKIFDTSDLIIQKEIQMFPLKDDGKNHRRTQEIISLHILNDKKYGPFIVA